MRSFLQALSTLLLYLVLFLVILAAIAWLLLKF